MLVLSAGRLSAGEAGPVVVLLSDQEDAYQAPLASFTEEIGVPVRTFNLRGDISSDPRLADKIFALRPPLIFTLGAKASYAAKLWTSYRREIPVVFAMVLNWRRYHLLEDSHNIAGIAAETAPGTIFANLMMFSPEIRRIGVIYSRKHSGQVVAEARQAAGRLGIELVAETISVPRDFRRSYRKLVERVDAFWLLPDPVAYTLDNITWLEERCVRDQLICMAESGNVARVGMLLAVASDFAAVGTQAASLARSIMDGSRSPAEIGVMPPLGTRLIYNLKTADRIGLEANPTAINIATEVID